MSASRQAFENDFCPVREDLLGEMYRANENGLPRLVETVTPDVRAMLALFLLSSQPSAFAGAGRSRQAVLNLICSSSAAVSARRFMRWRKKARPRVAPAPTSYGHRKPITLSTKPLQIFQPMHDDIDDEDDGIEAPVAMDADQAAVA